MDGSEGKGRWWEAEGEGYDTDLDLAAHFVWDKDVLKKVDGEKKGTERSDEESDDKSYTKGEKADEDNDEDDDNEKEEGTKTVVRASKRAKTKRQK